MPLQLLHSVLSPFLWIGTLTDSFHSSGSSSLFQMAMTSLCIAPRRYKCYICKKKNILIIWSTHKNSNSNKGARSVFQHFCPGLPVSLTLCPISQCGTLSQMVSLHGFAEVAQHAVGVGADSIAVEVCTLWHSNMWQLDNASTQKRTSVLHNGIVHKGCSGIMHLLTV